MVARIKRAMTQCEAMISSPCIKICEIEPQSRLCRGCGRSLNEIAQWGSLSEAQRLAIMAILPERLHQAGLPQLTAPDGAP